MRNIVGMIMCIVVLGCTHIPPNYDISIDGCADRIAVHLSKGLKASYLGVSILVSTPVDAVTFAPSDFGLALQEFLIGSLVRQGANVVDVQLRNEPYITCEEGLISLSRDAGRLKGEFRAEVIIASTYLVREKSVVITSRAIDVTTNDVIASTTTILRRTDLIADLLDHTRQVRIYEK
jgi:hypothetical protein